MCTTAAAPWLPLTTIASVLRVCFIKPFIDEADLYVQLHGFHVYNEVYIVITFDQTLSCINISTCSCKTFP